MAAITYTGTYSLDENKLRLYASARLDAETYARVKAAGFQWAPKQECFYTPAWHPQAETLLLDLCGEIDDEDMSLDERAAIRAERFEDYSEKRSQEATQAHTAATQIMDGIPSGQPILVGHHSERRARKDAERIENGIRKAVNLLKTSQYWERRAASARAHAKYHELPAVRSRRIKTLQAEQRKHERSKIDSEKELACWTKEGLTRDYALMIANYSREGGSFTFPLADYPREPPASQYQGLMSLWGAMTDGIITHEQARDLAVPSLDANIAYRTRWIEHLGYRIAYEQAQLTTSGGTIADKTGPEKGGAIRCWAGRGLWFYIQKVNKVTVSILDTWNEGQPCFTRTIKLDDIKAVMTKAAVDQARAENRIVDTGDTRGFHLSENTPAVEEVSAPPPPPIHETPAPAMPTLASMEATLKAGIQVVTVEQLFATPPCIADRLIDAVDLQPGEQALEPSAGTGRILDAMGRVPGFFADPRSDVLAIEINPALSLALPSHLRTGMANRCEDFLSVEPDTTGLFDVVIMNPPFAKGQDVAHVTHALRFLKPGGRLAAIMSNAITFNTHKPYSELRTVFEALHATIEPLPQDSFKEEGTAVNTVLVTLTLPTENSMPTVPHIPLTDDAIHNWDAPYVQKQYASFPDDIKRAAHRAMVRHHQHGTDAREEATALNALYALDAPRRGATPPGIAVLKDTGGVLMFDPPVVRPAEAVAPTTPLLATWDQPLTPNVPQASLSGFFGMS